MAWIDCILHVVAMYELALEACDLPSTTKTVDAGVIADLCAFKLS